MGTLIKILVVAAAIVGVLFMLNAYAPEAWTAGFDIKGHHIPWGFPIIGAFLVLAWRLKSK